MNRMLYLHQDHWQQMLTDVKSKDQEEACGLVAGEGMTSCAVFPITNELHSPIRYRMNPEEQLEVFIKIDENNWDLLAIYHSHLRGPSQPSVTDVAEAMYPGLIHIIWYPSGDEWVCKGYLIESGTVEQVPITLVNAS